MQKFVVKNVTRRTTSYIKRYLEPKPTPRISDVQKDDVKTDSETKIIQEEPKNEPEQILEPTVEKKSAKKSSNKKKRNNVKEKRVKEMDTNEKIKIAAEILEGMPNMEDKSVKRVKKDKGLIERVESSKIILTEDNKELLND